MPRHDYVPLPKEIMEAWFNEVQGPSNLLIDVDNPLSEERGPEPGVSATTSAIKPEVVCLCGSTRFFKVFDEQNFRLTLEGKIVLSIGCNTKSDDGLRLTREDKHRLDELHKRKIDLADYVLVLNVGGYIGESTRSEIEYAIAHGKPVRYLESPEPRGEG